MPSKKKNKGNSHDEQDPFNFEDLVGIKQVTLTKPARNKVDVELTQAASGCVLIVSCRKTRNKTGTKALFTYRV